MPSHRKAPHNVVSSRIVALALAEEFLGTGDSDAAYRSEIRDTALIVGNWLAEQGKAGRWDTIEIAVLIESVDFVSSHDRDGFLLALSGLLGYAGLVGHLSAARTRAYFRDICALAAAPQVADFLDGAQHFFEEPLN